MYRGPQLSRQNQKLHGKNKIPHGKNKMPHGKTKNFTAKTKYLTAKTKCLKPGKSKYPRQNQSYFVFAVKYLVLPWGFWFCRDSCRPPYKCNITRGTQLEYGSKPLKHSIVKRILVLNGRYIYPLKMFHQFAFPSCDPKIIGIKTYLFETFSQKKGSRKF